MDDITLQYFGLQKDKNIVVRATNTKLIDHIEEIMENDDRFADLDIEFLKTSRIEINAVIAQLAIYDFGNSLWINSRNYIQQEIITELLNCQVKTPTVDETDLYPNAIRKLILHVRNVVANAVEETEKKIELEQENVKGFLEVVRRNKKTKILS